MRGRVRRRTSSLETRGFLGFFCCFWDFFGFCRFFCCYFAYFLCISGKNQAKRLDKRHFSEYIMKMPKPKAGAFSRTLVEMIEARLRALRISVHAAEKRYGFPPESLRSVLRGSSPSVDRFKRICDALEIDFTLGATLATRLETRLETKIGTRTRRKGFVGVLGKMGHGEDEGEEEEGSVVSSLHRVGESRDCPIVGIVRAGSEIEYWNDQFPGGESIGVPGELFGDGDGVVRRWGGVVVRGESMSPIFDDGDILFFDMRYGGEASGLIGRACVVETAAGGAMVKRLERGRKAGMYNLESYNRHHAVVANVVLRTARPVMWVKKG